MQHRNSIALLALFAATSLSVGARADSYTYTAITDPASPAYTEPRGINNSGVVVGYISPNNSFSETGGVFTSANVAGAFRTRARGINDSGAVVGFYKATATSAAVAFVQSGGSLSTFSFAGAAVTQGTAINHAGSVVGGYIVGNVTHAFQYVGGTASEIVVPGAAYTFATGINNAGDIVGYDSTDVTGDTGATGFLVHNGVVSTIAVPGAAVTNPLGINSAGEIVGDYIQTAGGYEQPFALIGGIYTLLDVPQSIYPSANVTDATGVNDAGVIVGYSGDSNLGNYGGYLATPIAGAPLNIALTGGDANAPVALPISQISSVSGAIGGLVNAQFYSFNWAGGAFGATLSVTGADPTNSYDFELCSGSSCGPVLDSTTLTSGDWTGTLSDTLAAGAYTIGLAETQPGTDPGFKLSFDSPVTSAVPEPAAWVLMLAGFGGLGAVVRARRRATSAA